MSLVQYIVIIIGASSSVLALIATILVIWNTNSQRLELYRRKLEAFNIQKTRVEASLKEANK
ncbi:MAG: hypothetical protein BWY69_00072 [Planctomycetes bacterium ADurb.Bin401]|jgi:type II secretory pathway component PulM|nr:MAG: hypothetical protein BWY69_00072 [Planctomycetes bacterium ADurb.Bin401]